VRELVVYAHYNNISGTCIEIGTHVWVFDIDAIGYGLTMRRLRENSQRSSNLNNEVVDEL